MAEPVARPSPELLAPLAWFWVSWPKIGRSMAWLTVPTVRTRPSAPATTAMRWLMVFTDAALVRTAWGSLVKDEEAKEPKADFAALRLAAARPAAGRAPSCWPRAVLRLASPAAAVASAAIRAGVLGWAVPASAATCAETTGIAAVAGSASAAGSAGVAFTTGMAAVGGPGVVDSERGGAATTGMASVRGSSVGDSAGVLETDSALGAASGATTAWAARSRSIARRCARVMGAAVGSVAVAGAAVVLSISVAGPLGWARRRPVGLVGWPSPWARRG